MVFVPEVARRSRPSQNLVSGRPRKRARRVALDQEDSLAAEAAEQIRRKEHGWGTLGKLEQARRHRAEEWERCKVSSW